MYQTNPEIPINMVSAAFERFSRNGYVVYPPQKRIYKNLVDRFDDRLDEHETCKDIIEVGMGIGVGTAWFNNAVPFLDCVGTDRYKNHVAFAKELFPWCSFDQWDVSEKEYSRKFDIVIAIDVIEHIKNYELAIHNMVNTAKKELWFSTPNKNSLEIAKDRPANQFHVREFTVQEFIDALKSYGKVEVRHWDTFEVITDMNSKVTPLVYKLCV